MNDFFKMDIFFVVTTCVVILWGLFGIVAFYYVIRILIYIKRLARHVAEEADEIRDDIAEIRAEVREEGARLKHVFQFFTGALQHPVKRSRKK